MSKCLNCETQIETNTGRRPKKYCSDICRATHYQKNKPKEKRFVQMATYSSVLEENVKLKEELQQIKATVSDFKPQEPTKTKKEGKPTQKEDKAPVEAENASQDDIEPEDRTDERNLRIAQIEADLKLPPKYLPKHKRTELTKELNELKDKL